MDACTHGLTTGCVVHHRTDLYEPYTPPEATGLQKIRAIDLEDTAHLLRIVEQRKQGNRPEPFIHRAPEPTPERRPQARQRTRVNSNRITKPNPKQPPQWQPQTDAKRAAKAKKAKQAAELDSAMDLRQQTQDLAARLGVTL